jgi:hypothetical protein
LDKELSLVTRQQLYDMGLSIPTVNSILLKLRPVYLKNKSSEPRYVFADFQEMWCVRHKGVWIEAVSNRPVRRFTKMNPEREVLSWKQGCLYYDIMHILKFFSGRSLVSYRKIRTLVYFLWINRYIRYAGQVNYEYVTQVGSVFNKKIKQALVDLVEQKAIFYLQPVELPMSSKYYALASGFDFHFRRGIVNLCRSYRGNFSAEDYLVLQFGLGILTRSPETRQAKFKLKKIDYNTIVRIFRDTRRVQAFYEIIKERIEVINAPETNNQ